MRVAEAVEVLGGFATRDELLSMRCWAQSIDMGVYYGKILRVRQGQYASKNLPTEVLRALRVGGRLACVSALALYAAGPASSGIPTCPDVPTGFGRWVWPELRPPLHVLVKHGSSRHGIEEGERVVLHWSRLDLPGTRLVVAENIARAQAARCE